MKLIVDIPDEMVEAVKINQYCGTKGRLEDIIANGTPYNPSGDLISRSDALKAVDTRHEELLHDTEYRRKHCQIDLLGIKKHILAIPTVEAYSFEQVQELVKLNQQFAQEIENLKRPKSEWKETTHLWETNLSGGMGYDWGYYYACPICSLEVSEKTDFCPQCGADMRDGVE